MSSYSADAPMDPNVLSYICANFITAGYTSPLYSLLPRPVWRDHLENFTYAMMTASKLEVPITVGALVLVREYQDFLKSINQCVCKDVEEAVRLFVTAYMVSARMALDPAEADLSMEHWEDVTFQQYTAIELKRMERGFYEALPGVRGISEEVYDGMLEEVLAAYGAIVAARQKKVRMRERRKRVQKARRRTQREAWAAAERMGSLSGEVVEPLPLPVPTPLLGRGARKAQVQAGGVDKTLPQTPAMGEAAPNAPVLPQAPRMGEAVLAAEVLPQTPEMGEGRVAPRARALPQAPKMEEAAAPAARERKRSIIKSFRSMWPSFAPAARKSRATR